MNNESKYLSIAPLKVGMGKNPEARTLQDCTVDEVKARVITCKPDKPMGEWGVGAHLEVCNFYKEEAKKTDKKFHYSGLYSATTQENEIIYVGRSHNNIQGEIGRRTKDSRWDGNSLYFTITDFPEQRRRDDHIDFFEVLFIVLFQPRENKDEKNDTYPKRHEFIRAKKLTMEEIWWIRDFTPP